MLGGAIRLLLAGLAIMFAGLVVLAVVEAVVMPLLAAVAFLAPFAIVFWLLSQQSRWQHRPRIGLGGAPRRAWRRWQAFARAPEPDPVQWAREAREVANQIRKLVRKANRTTRDILGSAPANAQKLADRAGELAALWKSVDEHLRAGDRDDQAQRATEIEQLAQATEDPLAREGYTAAAQSLEQEARLCAELRATRDRLHAEVARILTALTILRTQIVSAQTGTAPAAGSVDQVAGDLADLESQVEGFSDSVRQVLRQASQPPGAR